ncbi:MAG: SH3 domain-containing protein [Cyclobacteriaceae bacterium]|nr:SH3 domain-containing protein [Cyclobacteriaceae bacterium]
MRKSQNQNINLFIFFLAIFLSVSISAFCDSPKEKLSLADSLFKQKKYTQSFELYENILFSDKKTSSAMLLKMAFIKEGLGDFTNALYYLDLYYQKTYDKKVLKKMEKLAEQQNLSGYDYDDMVLFLNIYHRYQVQIDIIIVALAFLAFGMLWYEKKNKKLNGPYAGSVFAAVLVALLLLNNFAREHTKAIITAPSAYLMKGPSPGAPLLDIATQGNRVEILGQEDVWVKISWNDQPAFIKASNLKALKL